MHEESWRNATYQWQKATEAASKGKADESVQGNLHLCYARSLERNGRKAEAKTQYDSAAAAFVLAKDTAAAADATLKAEAIQP